MLLQLGGQAGHLLLERLAVVLDFGRANIAPRRQDVAVVPDVVQRRALAEAGKSAYGFNEPEALATDLGCSFWSLTLPARLILSPRQAW